MLVQKGGGTNIRDVWIDNANRTQVHRQRLPLRELIGQGTYRIDQPVDSMSYDEVHLLFLNAVADPLWRMVFNRTSVRSGKWFEEVKRSSSNISGYNFTITDSRQPPYSVCIGTGRCTDPAWAGIWRSEFTESPLFLFNADQQVPRILPHPTRKATYIACESKDLFDMVYQIENTNTMSIQDCQKRCTNFPYMLMELGYKCNCGSVKPGNIFMTSTVSDTRCELHCPGSNDRCGGQGLYIAVYEIIEKEPQNLEEIPCSTISSTQTVTDGEILVSKETISSDSSRYFYLKGHKIATSILSWAAGSYSMYYNLEDCDNATRKPYTDIKTETKMNYEYGKYWNTTLIKAVCVWFIPNQQIYIDQKFEVNIQVCTPTAEHYFFPADYLAVIGVNHTKPDSNTEMSNTEQWITTLGTFTNYNQQFEGSGNIVATVENSVTEGTNLTGLGTSSTLDTESTDKQWIQHTSPILDTESKYNQWIQQTTPEQLGNDVTVTDYAKSITDVTTHMMQSGKNNNVSQSHPLCPCVCEKDGLNLTKEELQEKIEKIESILRVNKKELASSYRKLTSAPDPRPSSKGIGASGIVVMLSFVGVIILMDLSNLQRLMKFWSSLGNRKK